jgi:hypothetical protein
MSEQQAIQREFFDIFSRMEHRLKRSGFLKQNRADAQADWSVYARALGEPFFAEAKRSGIADTLINRPPAKLMNDLAWEAPKKPLDGVENLFTHGVARVRNSLFHGEKFVGAREQRERDLTLVAEALAVLKLAEQWLKRVDQPGPTTETSSARAKPE